MSDLIFFSISWPVSGSAGEGDTGDISLIDAALLSISGGDLDVCG